MAVKFKLIWASALKIEQNILHNTVWKTLVKSKTIFMTQSPYIFTPCAGGSQQEQEEPPGEGLPQVPGGGEHLQGLHAHGRGKS